MLIAVGGIQESLAFPVTQGPHRRILVEALPVVPLWYVMSGNVDRIGAPGAYLDNVRCTMVRIGRITSALWTKGFCDGIAEFFMMPVLSRQ
jgi:hypothetical protein